MIAWLFTRLYPEFKKEIMPHDAMYLLSRYGYVAVLAGTMLEGETVVLVAGFLAHQGYLSLPMIIFCAFVGSTVSDQGLFFLSRFKGPAVLNRFPNVSAKVGRLSSRLSSHPKALYVYSLVFRFLYGLRNVSPVFLGLSTIPTSAFVVLNIIGALVWAAAFSSAGFFFGRALQSAAGSLQAYEAVIAGILVLAGAGFAAFRHWRKAKPRDGRGA